MTEPGFASLAEIEKYIWSELSIAPASLEHPWRFPVFGTRSRAGCELRTVVLRKFDALRGCLYCHTDVRSQKVAQLRFDPRTQWLFYNPQTRIQLRVTASPEGFRMVNWQISSGRKVILPA
ncbi:MAG: hypothetical protein R3C11_18740 [Planctomycetaceae bacterium]